MAIGGGPVALAVTQNNAPGVSRLAVRLTGRPVDQGVELLARSAIERLFGLTVDLSGFAAMAESDPLLGPLARRMRGLKPPRFPTVFEALVNGVACQQLSLAVGIHLLNRLTSAYGRPPAHDPLGPRAFPDPDQLACVEPEELKGHGFSLAKAHTIVDAAQAIVAGDLDLESLAHLDDADAIRASDGPARHWSLDRRVRDAPGARPAADLSWRRCRGAQQAQALLRHRHQTGL
ncbi:MAG: hypothetical protein M3063_16565 [Actinomycetota bacterium]|nr:hypothetical protein [Actinomycetota bacterium]